MRTALLRAHVCDLVQRVYMTIGVDRLADAATRLGCKESLNQDSGRSFWEAQPVARERRHQTTLLPGASRPGGL